MLNLNYGTRPGGTGKPARAAAVSFHGVRGDSPMGIKGAQLEEGQLEEGQLEEVEAHSASP